MNTHAHTIEPLESRIAPANAAVIELSGLTGGDGFQINGEIAGDFSGRSLSAAGDVNGDGFGDLIVGANLASPNGVQSGSSYVIFGTGAGFPANLELSALTGGNGFQISGVLAGDFAGRSVSAAGDVNHDGFDDIIIGADGADPNGHADAGASYVVFGRNAFAPNLSLSTLDGTNGFKISGEAAGDATGRAVSAAGDINGDGFDDVIIGADRATGSVAVSGASYVVFGHTGTFAANINLAELTATVGFKIAGEAANDFLGHSVSAAGDINGDGFDDVIIGAYHATGNAADTGASYVLFGKAGGFETRILLTTLDGNAGFKLSGVTPGDFTGYSASGVGDVNGDGFDDVIVGAVFAGPNGVKSGASYVVFGKAGGFAANVDLSTLDGTAGFRVSGEATIDFAGTSVSAAGDVNGDGFDDLHIGANGLDTHGSYTGASYVVFGKAGSFGANLNLSTLDGSNGFQINGEAMNDFAGSSVSAGGDVNGDGFADVFIAARFAGPNGFQSGASYVVFGKGTTIDPTISATKKSATFTDADGDLVTVKTNIGDLTGKLALFAFRGGARLDTLDLRDAQFDGANIKITAVKAGAGDGLVNVGRIDATDRDLGKVTVKGDLSVVDCGDGDFSDPSLKLLSVGSMGRYGPMLGAPDLQSDILGLLSALKVAGDVKDVVIITSGGANGKIGSVTIAGSLIGGELGASGVIASSGDIGSIKIGRDIVGGTGESAGLILGQAKIGAVTIGGSLFGAGETSARITSISDMGPVKIGRDVIGGDGPLSCTIDCGGKLTSITIGGSLIGGAGDETYTDANTVFHEGQVFAIDGIGPVKVGHDVIGGDGFGSGQIRTDGAMGPVTIGGSLIGGEGLAAGHIASEGDMAAVKIGRDVIGTPGAYNGYIESFGTLAGVTIGGSLIGGSGFFSGAITSFGEMGAVNIRGDVIGTSVTGPSTASIDYSGYIGGGRIASIVIGGSLIAGIDNSTTLDLFHNGSVRVIDDIGAITVKGSLIGHSTSNGFSPVIISARGQETPAPGATSDIAIKSLKVGGRVEHAQILAGYDSNLNPTNGNAQIGKVSVGKDWIASDLVAGVKDTSADGFGDRDDVLINMTADTVIAKIASIAIKGAVLGSSAVADHFGFVAQSIGSFKAAGFKAPLSAASSDFILLSPATGDVTVREVEV